MPAVREQYEVELRCPRCRRTTAHLVTAGPHGRSRVTCAVCGRAVTVDTLQFIEQYADGVVRRLFAKPRQMTAELARHPVTFIASLPGRVFTKPFRVAAELRTTMDIVRPRRRSAPSSGAAVAATLGELPDVARQCRVLLSGPLLWAHAPGEILEVAHDLGYDGVELWAHQLLREDADLAALQRQAAARGLHLTLHALSWDLNPTSQVGAIRTASVEALHRSIEVAASLGAALVVMHPGRATVPHDDGEPYWPALVETIRELADHAAQRGLALGVEHMEARQSEYVVSADDANRLIRDVDRPNVGTVLDVAHIPWGQDEVAFARSLERIVHVHLSDADEARLHLPLGEGRRDLARVLGALHGYRGAIAIEGYSISAGAELARWNKAQFEELWRASAG